MLPSGVSLREPVRGGAPHEKRIVEGFAGEGAGGDHGAGGHAASAGGAGGGEVGEFPAFADVLAGGQGLSECGEASAAPGPSMRMGASTSGEGAAAAADEDVTGGRLRRWADEGESGNVCRGREAPRRWSADHAGELAFEGDLVADDALRGGGEAAFSDLDLVGEDVEGVAGLDHVAEETSRCAGRRPGAGRR